ncbi:hypothetical protein A3I40_00390 [Candidatus Uhrbacteria bacterium RIFCSPLOWO2_02_FULL_48_12]|uniref:GIY-YIG domain-containing protein n=1 Tax=Candidatus Uhrbacteria bacterium RIFCSPLOWO2_02_FULL_48_12 TaxID=1802407 RepID=A0A1F7V6B8_9BACT|nr:MAG: hypothetical protein A3I40_00390 [Candidatus Uhrbacteria bacterium RIFCSPLOWO2_02_FULL_48_12]
MKFMTYVLVDKNGKLYKGATGNLERRMRDHIRGKTKTTRAMHGLTVVYKEEYESFGLARAREVYFKTAAGRRFLKKIMGS